MNPNLGPSRDLTRGRNPRASTAPRRARVTSRDVAARAGVSRATVSYVLNDTPGQSIPEATRRRVLAAVAELGYVPHASARALRSGSSELVLFITREGPIGAQVAMVVEILTRGLARSGRTLVTWQNGPDMELAPVLAQLQARLAVALFPLSEADRDALRAVNVPVVSSEYVSNAEQYGRLAGRMQVLHLASRGHRRIGALTTDDPLLDIFAGPRLTGVRLACAEQGLAEPEVVSCAQPGSEAVDHLVEVLKAWRSPDHAGGPVSAIAAYNDVHALMVLSAASRLGLAVPDDLAVIGIDDDVMGTMSSPSLSTVRTDISAISHALLARVLAALDDAPVPSQVSPTHLDVVIRESA